MNDVRSDGTLESGRPFGWTVVLPFKGGRAAKSRLGAPGPVATAIALDCLQAVLASERVGTVVVVTPDPELAAEAVAAGARVRPESVPGAGLLAALNDGLAGLEGPCAVLLGDLPALLPEDLDSALRQAEQVLGGGQSPRPRMVFVPDADNVGTVLLAALDPAAMVPSFGQGSAGAHQAAGAVRLDLDLPRLRRDVDTPADLQVAMALGLGPRTLAVLEWLTESTEPAGNRA